MKNIARMLLATAAIGVAAIGSASAMPFTNAAAALDESQVQNVRIVCDQYGRCYDTRRTRRVVRPYVAQRYYDDGPAYYAQPGYAYAPGYAYGGPRRYYGGPGYGYGPGPGYGYGPGPGYGYGPGVGIGIGPFGFSVR